MTAPPSAFDRLSIAAKINLVLALVFVSVFALAAVLLGQWLGERFEKRTVTELEHMNQQVIDMIDAYASVLEHSAQMLGQQFAANLPRNLREAGTDDSGVPLLRAGDGVLNDHFELVDGFTAATGAVATVFVRQDDDFVRINTSLKKEDGSRAQGTKLGSSHPAYQRMMAGEPYTGRAQLFGREYMTHYQPLKRDGRVIGIAFVGIDFTDSLQALKAKVLALRVGETGYVFALDALKTPGLAVIHPAAEGKSLIDAKDSKGRSFVREMIERKQGVMHYDWANTERGETRPRERITVFTTFERWGWLIGTGSYSDEFRRELFSLQMTLIVGGAVMVLAMLAAVAFATRRWLATPLGEALGAIRQVADGDLRVRVQASSQDEVGQLLDAADRMCTRLREMVGEIERDAGQLTQSARQMSGTARQVSKGSGEQSEAAAAMAAAVEQLTASIDLVASNASDARAMATNASEISDRGASVIRSAIDGMAHIAGTVRQSSAAVAQLGEQSQQITSIVNVIREIADQTNLLALNAAIEAARAGEAGRGFAVVADEVRKLAERTSSSTQEIAAMVERIQNDANAAVQAMEDGVRQVEEGSRYAQDASSAIGEIKGSATNVDQSVIAIADALREQTAASQDIARNVERVAGQAEANHAQAQEASAAAEQMEQLASRVHAAIGRFRL